MVWNTGLCLARWGQPPPPGCTPSWIPVKINPVLAKPRTIYKIIKGFFFQPEYQCSVWKRKLEVKIAILFSVT